MSLPHKSVPTIGNVEFIKLEPSDISPLISKCEIKVLYLNENRNASYINKETATKMAKTLRGNPIVGYYKKEKEDFRDHGDQLTINGDEFKFESLTKPYGFISPDAQVWFKDFEDEDDFGNKIIRTYLMTTGYLWTERYEECKSAIESGKPQSMELDPKTVDGKWSTNVKTNMEFFIVNDAIFSALCILGDDIEPCFEGASVTAPDISTSFTLNDEFIKDFYTMMQQFNFALKGGKQRMENEKNLENVNTDFSKTQGKEEESSSNKIEESTVSDFACGGGEKKKKEYKEEEEKKKDNKEGNSDEQDKKDEDEKDKKNKDFSLENKIADLESRYALLESEYKKLVAFKADVEDKKKDEMIKSFYMLSDEDKKDVIDNKSKYSLDEIESKLSVICVRKKVNFNLEEEKSNNNSSLEEHNETITTFSLNNESTVPAWVKAVKSTQAKRNN